MDDGQGPIPVPLVEEDHVVREVDRHLGLEQLIGTRRHDHEQAVVRSKGAQQASPSLSIQPADTLVEPHLAGAERARPLALEVHLARDRVLGHRVAGRSPPLDGNLGEVDVDLQGLQPGHPAEVDGDLFGFPVGVGTEPEDLTSRSPLGDRIHLVPGHGGDVEALHKRPPTAGLLAVAVDQVVRGALIASLPDAHVENVLAKEGLGRHLGHLHRAILPEDDDVGDVRAVTDVLPFSPRHVDAHEALLEVGVEFVVGDGHLGAVDGAEGLEHGFALPPLAELLLQLAVPLHRVVGEVGQVVLDLVDLHLEVGDALIGLLGVELGDALDPDLGQARDILVGDRTDQMLDVRFESGVDGLQDGLPGLALLDVAVDAVLDEDLLQRSEVP